MIGPFACKGHLEPYNDHVRLIASISTFATLGLKAQHTFRVSRFVSGSLIKDYILMHIDFLFNENKCAELNYVRSRLRELVLYSP